MPDGLVVKRELLVCIFHLDGWERVWGIQLEFRCSSCPMESRCGRGGACVWCVKSLESYTVLNFPTGSYFRALVRSVLGSWVYWGAKWAFLYGLIRAQSSFLVDSAPPWLSLLEQSLENLLVLHAALEQTEHPSACMARWPVLLSADFCLPCGIVGISTCFPQHIAVMGSRTRESKLNPFSGLSTWSDQGHSHGWEDPGLWALPCSSRHSSALFLYVAAPLRVQSAAEVPSALSFPFNLLKTFSFSESLVQRREVTWA